jgi:hypothetical protein
VNRVERLDLGSVDEDCMGCGTFRPAAASRGLLLAGYDRLQLAMACCMWPGAGWTWQWVPGKWLLLAGMW